MGEDDRSVTLSNADPRMFHGRHGWECAVCGAPFLQKGRLHAEWCAGVAESLRRNPTRTFLPLHGTTARYVMGCDCLACYRAWIDYHRSRERR